MEVQVEIRPDREVANELKETVRKLNKLLQEAKDRSLKVEFRE